MSLHDTEHEIISRSINQEGCFECPILKSLLNALKKSPDASLIDIGGNIGMYSLYAASYGHNVITFEPMKVNQEKICQSILSNMHFQDRITLIGAATSNSSASKYVDLDTKGFKQAVQKKGDLNYGSGKVEEINSENNAPPPGDRGVHYAHSLTIDSLQGTKHLPQPGSHIVLKVDVEGSECKALLGSLNYLSMVKIDYAAIELSPGRMQECQKDGGALEKIFDLFTSNGLELYLFDNNKEWMKVDPVNWKPWALKKTSPRSRLFDVAWSKGTPTIIL
jgi:FkbM family methyltransferase